jgi:hypothetical protein
MRNRKIAFYGVLIIILVGAIAANLMQYQPASDQAIKYYEQYQSTGKMVEDANSIKLRNVNSVINLIICPENQVDPRSYMTMADYFYQKGYHVTIIKYPSNNVYLGGKRYIDYLEPLLTNVLLGHGQGIIWPSKFITKRVDGIVNLGGFINHDLTGTQLPTINIIGDNDPIFTRGMYNLKKYLLSEKSETYILGGANHSYFSDYGLAMGDEAGVGFDSQFIQTTGLINDWIKDLRK